MRDLFRKEIIHQNIVDEVEEKGRYTEDDVVEVFIRANDGGTKLSRSDLLFSLLSSTWDHAQEQTEQFLDHIDRMDFPLGRDFVLKTCLTLLDKKARYEVAKFRTPGVREEIEKQWGNITKAIEDTIDFVKDATYIKSGKGVPSSLMLIPMIYSRYHAGNRDSLEKISDKVGEYFLRGMLVGAFSGQPDQIIDECVEQMIKDTEKDKGNYEFDIANFFQIAREKGRNLEVTPEHFQKSGYGTTNIHFIFNILYKEFNYKPAYDGNLPQVDHIFPISQMENHKKPNPDTGRMVMVHRKPARNRLGNCMLLTREENGPGGKGDKTPDVWFADKDDDYLKLHCIPDNPELWKVERFEDFCTEREKMIMERLPKLTIS